ncbi:hypothetical protein Tco_0716670 [Tanacetum coccineum]
MNDDTPMCERHEANYIQSEGYQNQNSHDLSPIPSEQTQTNNDSEKSLTKLNNDVKNDLKYFKSCIRSMKIVHDKLFDKDDGKTTGVLPNKKSKIVKARNFIKSDLENQSLNLGSNKKVKIGLVVGILPLVIYVWTGLINLAKIKVYRQTAQTVKRVSRNLGRTDIDAEGYIRGTCISQEQPDISYAVCARKRTTTHLSSTMLMLDADTYYLEWS